MADQKHQKETTQEGHAPFPIPSIPTPCYTYYRIIGDLRTAAHPPVIILHGGPGSGHEYLLPYAALWKRCSIPVIFYDQIGCASSTLLPQTAGDSTFWTMDLLVDQLDKLIEHLDLREKQGFSLLGHSFGGMVGSFYATRRPHGLHKLILANSPATTDLHVVGLKICWRQLPEEAVAAMEEAIRSGDYESTRYREAELLVRRTFWSTAQPYPVEGLRKVFENHGKDNTVAGTMYGNSPLQCTGSTHGWNCFDALPNINVPTLVYNAEFDLETKEAVAPYVDLIPGTKFTTVQGASHMCHLDGDEILEKVLSLVGDFLLGEGV